MFPYKIGSKNSPPVDVKHTTTCYIEIDLQSYTTLVNKCVVYINNLKAKKSAFISGYCDGFEDEKDVMLVVHL